MAATGATDGRTDSVADPRAIATARPGARQPQRRHHQRPEERPGAGRDEDTGEAGEVDDGHRAGQQHELRQADRDAVARGRPAVLGGRHQLGDQRAPGHREQPEPDPAHGRRGQHRREVGGQREQRRRRTEQHQTGTEHRAVPRARQQPGYGELGEDRRRHEHAGGGARRELPAWATHSGTTGSSSAYPEKPSVVTSSTRRNGRAVVRGGTRRPYVPDRDTTAGGPEDTCPLACAHIVVRGD
jgi:hypothetical protein